MNRAEKIAYFKKKWRKEHRFEMVMAVIIAAALFIAGIVMDNGLQFAGTIGICIYSVIWNNRMMSYVERHVYMEGKVK